jgi:very-short-patch-repair endonuclease
LFSAHFRARFNILVLGVPCVSLRNCKIPEAVPSSESSHETARKLRREQTVAENILWRHLRGRRLCNIKFRRQFPIGPYFSDFCSIERRLIIEVDGGQHADRSADDEVRTTYLTSRGYRVIRFWNDQVLASADQVLADIEKFLGTHSSES